MIDIASIDFVKDMDYLFASFVINNRGFFFQGAEIIFVFRYSLPLTVKTARLLASIIIFPEFRFVIERLSVEVLGLVFVELGYLFPHKVDKHLASLAPQSRQPCLLSLQLLDN